MKASLFWLILITIIWIVSIEEKEKITVVETKIGLKEVTKIKPNQENISFPIQVIKLVEANLGKPYVFGKMGPDAFDCSGFVYGIHKQLNLTLPRTSLAQSQIEGHKITRELLKKGDLVFFDTALEGHVNHSGIYLGEGKFIHASSGKANSVTISNIDAWYKDKFKWGKRINANK
jgi:cell wall-associated NlpC family hydrolase